MLGPVSYLVELGNGRQRKCHQDHLRMRVVDDGSPEMSQVLAEADSFPVQVPTRNATQENSSDQRNSGSPTTTLPSSNEQTPQAVDSVPPSRSSESGCHYLRQCRKSRQWFEPGTI